MHELTLCKLNNPFYIKVELSYAETQQHTVWDIVKRLVDIGTDIIRVECRLYPTIFPEQRTFTISTSVILEKFEVKKVEPFKLVSQELRAIQKRLQMLNKSENKLADSIQVCFNYLKIMELILVKKTT
jgi:hypothetical protein